MSGEKVDASIIPVERIERTILLLRGEKVLLDQDLAELYGTETRLLTRAVRRNLNRFPADFMFRLTDEEHERLRSQIGISKGRGGRRSPPYAFTELGVAMLSSVLRSERAVLVNVEIMRAFVQMRRWAASHEDLSVGLAELGARCDEQFDVIFEALEQLLPAAAAPPERRIGFQAEDE